MIMYNYQNTYDQPVFDGTIFGDAPVGILHSPQIKQLSHNSICRYVNILIDKWFKKILGAEKNKKVLLDILRELIPERNIVDIKYDRKGMRKRNAFEGCHDAVFDVECIDVDGTRFVVEMQRTEQAHFNERALFYSTFPIQEQVIARNRNQKLNHDLHFDYPPVYIICFLNFSFHPLSNQIIHRYDLREKESGELMTDRINDIYIEMTNDKRGDEEPHNDDSFVEKLSWAFTHMSSLTERPASLMEEVFRAIFDACEIRALDENEQKEYKATMTTQWDLDDQMTTAYLKGEAKGLERGEMIGEARGETKKRNEIARALLSLGVFEDIIAKATEMTPKEVEALKHTAP